MQLINRRYDSECPVSDIQLHPRNARQGDIGAICQSIEHNGFFGACVVQESTGYILVGNHRYQAAVHSGASSVPVIFVDVDDERALKILLADNRLADLATWNDHALAELLEAIRSEYGLEGTGYDEEALQQLLEDVSAAALMGSGTTDGNCDEDETPSLELRPVSRAGDVWVCGDHRVMCGDSTSGEQVRRLLDGRFADMVFTDPPYNVDYDPESRPNGPTSDERVANPLGKIKNDSKSPEEFRRFLDQVYTAVDSTIQPGRAIYVCHADTEGHHFRNAFIAQPWKLQSCLIWKKTSLVFGRADYHWMHEPILYGWKQGEAHVWTGDRKQTTVIEIATEHIDRSGDTNGKYVHPTQKPVKLILVALENSSSPGEIVLDVFGGSGSTMIAAEKSGRRARLMELDPKFVDVIVKRWQMFTAGKATLEGDGRSFDDVSYERLGQQ